jgi:protein TonB
MLAAVFVTGILGFGVITGLNVAMVSRAVEHLQAIDIALPKLPPEPPPPKPEPRPRPKAQGAPAAPKASPIVAPKPEIQLPAKQVVAAAAQAGTGAASSNGQGGAGAGTGAGGTGSGAGGGGNTPAQLVRNLSRSDYRALTAGRLPQGAAGLAIRVDASGRVDSCRVEHSSGDPVIDTGLCPLISARLVFQPARNAAGQPIAYFTHYLATWRR